MMKMRLEEFVSFPDVGDSNLFRITLPVQMMKYFGGFLSSVIFNKTHDVVYFLSTLLTRSVDATAALPSRISKYFLSTQPAIRPYHVHCGDVNVWANYNASSGRRQ